MIIRILVFIYLVIFSTKTFAEIGYGLDFGAGFTSDSRVDEITSKRAAQGSPYVTSSYDDGAVFIRGFVSQSVSGNSIELGLFTANGFSADYTDGGQTGTDNYNINGIDAIFNIEVLTNVDIRFGGHYTFIDGDDNLVIGSGSHDIKSTNIDGTGIVVGTNYNFGSIRTGISYYGGVGGNSDAYMTVLTAGFSF